MGVKQNASLDLDQVIKHLMVSLTTFQEGYLDTKDISRIRVEV